MLRKVTGGLRCFPSHPSSSAHQCAPFNFPIIPLIVYLEMTHEALSSNPSWNPHAMLASFLIWAPNDHRSLNYGTDQKTDHMSGLFYYKTPTSLNPLPIDKPHPLTSNLNQEGKNSRLISTRRKRLLSMEEIYHPKITREQIKDLE